MGDGIRGDGIQGDSIWGTRGKFLKLIYEFLNFGLIRIFETKHRFTTF